MTADPLAEVLAKHEFWEDGEYVLNCKCGVKFYPDQKDAYHTHVAKAVRSFLAEHVAKPEVVEAVARGTYDSHRLHAADNWDTAVPVGQEDYRESTRAALAALLTTLGGESNE